MVQKVAKFFGEVKTEMSKVTWSSREELIHSTTIVLIVMIFMAVFLGAVDLVFSQLVKLLLR
jgi:preprotein translocase subunit SecE